MIEVMKMGIEEDVKKEIIEMSEGKDGVVEICDEHRRDYIQISWKDGYYDVLWESTGDREMMDIEEMKDFLDELEKESTYWIDADIIH